MSNSKYIVAREKFEGIVRDKRAMIIGNYINAKTTILMECFRGHKFSNVPSSINKGQWCRECYLISIKDSTRQALENIIQIKNGTLLSIYVNKKTKVKVQCQEGHVWDANQGDIMGGKWCPGCANCSPEEAEKCLKQIISSKNGILLSMYVNSRTKVRVQCSYGHIWESLASHINSGNWCFFCARRVDESRDEFYQIVIQKGGEVLEPYITVNDKIAIRCKNGHIWKVKPRSVKEGTWCQACSESSLEVEARVFLERNNVPLISQAILETLPRRRFDFYFEYNNNKYLLELDGKQHFEYIPFFHSTFDNFKYNQEVDRVKTYAAYVSGYRVIRIDYTQLFNTGTHILHAVNQNQSLYFSNIKMYEYIYEIITTDSIARVL